MNQWIKGLHYAKKYNNREEETSPATIKLRFTLIIVIKYAGSTGQVYMNICGRFMEHYIY